MMRDEEKEWYGRCGWWREDREEEGGRGRMVGEEAENDNDIMGNRMNAKGRGRRKGEGDAGNVDEDDQKVGLGDGMGALRGVRLDDEQG